jgi:iron-sulfur cluster assembly protein
MNNISITLEAAKEFKQKLLTNNLVVRFGVKGGSCSGLEYVLKFENILITDRDLTFPQEGFMLVVDNKSIVYVNNTVIDYKKSLMEEKFVFNNPQEEKSCSCGKSFSIK